MYVLTNNTVIMEFTVFRSAATLKLYGHIEYNYHTVSLLQAFVYAFNFMQMDGDYMLILRQGKNFRQFRLLKWNTVIGHFVPLKG